MKGISEVMQGASETMPRPLLLRLGQLLRKDAPSIDGKTSAFSAKEQLWDDLTSLKATATEDELLSTATIAQLQDTLGKDHEDASASKELLASQAKFVTYFPRPSVLVSRPPEAAEAKAPPAELWTKDAEAKKAQSRQILDFWTIEAAATGVQRIWRGKRVRDRMRANLRKVTLARQITAMMLASDKSQKCQEAGEVSPNSNLRHNMEQVFQKGISEKEGSGYEKDSKVRQFWNVANLAQDGLQRSNNHLVPKDILQPDTVKAPLSDAFSVTSQQPGPSASL
jgi:hypothetical protein